MRTITCVFTGGCARFWYGGCEAGRNHHDTEEECQAKCVSPRGSAVCYLPPVTGPCQGDYKEWYYDVSSQLCRLNDTENKMETDDKSAENSITEAVSETEIDS